MTDHAKQLRQLNVELDDEFQCRCSEVYLGRGRHSSECQAYMQPSTRDTIAAAADYIEAQQAEIDRLREALHDAIRRPMGVVPASAEQFYSAAEADAAEARRAALQEVK